MNSGEGKSLKIQRAAAASTAYEYGCDLRRLFPWEGVANPFWGAAHASVRAGERTTLDKHGESETFIMLRGQGRMVIDDESEVLEEGDIVFIPKNSVHYIENTSQSEPLTFISIFWDSPEARERIRADLLSDRDNI